MLHLAKRHNLTALPLVDGLQLFSRLKPHGFAWRNRDFRAGSRISPDTGFSRPYIEDTKTPQLNAVALGQRLLHAVEDGLNRQFSLGLGNSGLIDHFVDDVELDHGSPLLRKVLPPND